VRIAAIRYRTNTMLLLIADIDEQGSLQTLCMNTLAAARKNVDPLEHDSRLVVDRIAWIVNEYKNLSLQHRA